MHIQARKTGIKQVYCQDLDIKSGNFACSGKILRIMV